MSDLTIDTFVFAAVFVGYLGAVWFREGHVPANWEHAVALFLAFMFLGSMRRTLKEILALSKESSEQIAKSGRRASEISWELERIEESLSKLENKIDRIRV
jgi:hypothetical protein